MTVLRQGRLERCDFVEIKLQTQRWGGAIVEVGVAGCRRRENQALLQTGGCSEEAIQPRQLIVTGQRLWAAEQPEPTHHASPLHIDAVAAMLWALLNVAISLLSI